VHRALRHSVLSFFFRIVDMTTFHLPWFTTEGFDGGRDEPKHSLGVARSIALATIVIAASVLSTDATAQFRFAFCETTPWRGTNNDACQSAAASLPRCDRPVNHFNVVANLTSPTQCAVSWNYTELNDPKVLSWSTTLSLQTCGSGTYWDGTTCAKLTGCPVGANCKEPLKPCPCTTNPIAIANGSKYLSEIDLATPGFSLTRVYSGLNTLDQTPAFLLQSVGDAIGNFGVGWHHDSQRRIKAPPPGATIAWAIRPDARVLTYKLVGSVWTTDADITDRLIELKDSAGNRTGWTYYDAKTDESETYDLTGRVLSTLSRNGQQTQFAYTDGTTAGGYVLDVDGNPTTTVLPAGLLRNVTDFQGRVVQFGYDSLNRILKVTDPSGGHLRYAYDTTNNLVAVVFQDGSTRAYRYNEPMHTSNAKLPNALTGVISETGTRVMSYFYDTRGRAIDERFPQPNSNINRFQIVFDANGLKSTVTDPLGAVRVYNFANVLGMLRPTSQSQPAGAGSGAASSSTVYDSNGNVLSTNDFKGNRTCYAYDVSRNLETVRVEGLPHNAVCSTALAATTQANPARKITTTWHATFRLPATIVESLGVGGAGGTKTTTNTYDTSGNLTQRQIATPTGTRTWGWTYDAFGRILTSTDPLSRVTTYTYYPNTAAQNALIANSRGMLASITNPMGHTTNFTAYNGFGQVLSMTDPSGLVTSMTYDARQRMTARTVGSETTSYQYDPSGLLTRVTLPDASFLAYTYDGARRLTQVEDGLGNKMVYTLDAMGNRTKEDALDPTGALARTRSRVFDALSRLQKEIGGATPTTQVTQYTYDVNGNNLAVTDANNLPTYYTYDALNRLIEIGIPNTPSPVVTKYEYDVQNNLTKVTDPKNLQTIYGYNGFGELTSLTSPDTGLSSFTFDAAGNLLTKTDARGVVATYTYDNLNRVTAIQYPATTSATGSAPAQTVTYTYDSCTNGIGRLCGFSDRTGSTSYSYDLLGRVLSKAQTINGITQTISYRYNSVGLMDQVTLPSGKQISIAYANNRPTVLTVNGRQVIKAADYEPFGPVGEWTWGNDTTASPSKHIRYFDLDGRNTKIEFANAIDPTVILYDAANRITALQGLTNNAVDPAKSTTYGYNNLNRLSTATPGAGNPASTQAYTYDLTGNRLTNTINSVVTNYAYPSTSHRLTGLSGGSAKTFTHDAVGNRLTDGVQSWVYGGDNRPISVSLTSPTLTSIQAGINALGQRVLKTVNTSQATIITRFMYDESGRLVGEYDLNGAPIQETIWFNDFPVAVLK
jgi:YD repeat-containing protein